MSYIGEVHLASGRGSGSRFQVNDDGSANVVITGAPTLQVEGSVSNAPVAGIAATAQLDATTTADDLLDSDPDRVGFVIANRGAGDVWVDFDQDATAGSSYLLKPGETLSTPPGVAVTGRVSIIAASGSQDVRAFQTKRA